MVVTGCVEGGGEGAATGKGGASADAPDQTLTPTDPPPSPLCRPRVSAAIVPHSRIRHMVSPRLSNRTAVATVHVWVSLGQLWGGGGSVGPPPCLHTSRPISPLFGTLRRDYFYYHYPEQ